MRAWMILIGATAMLTACNSGTPVDAQADHEDHDHGDHEAHAQQADAAGEAEATDEAAGSAEVPTAVGDAITPEPTITTVEDIAADPASFAGRTVVVLGTPTHMCGSGCSATLETGDSKLMIRSTKEVFTFPAAWKGKEIVFEGVIEVDPGCASEHGGEHAEHAEPAEGAEPTYVLRAKGAALVPAAEPVAEPGAEPAAELAAEPAAEPADTSNKVE